MIYKLILTCFSSLLSLFIFCNQFPSDTSQTVPDGPVFLNDLLEPNNQSSQATRVVSDTLKNVVCIPSEYDWYKIPIDSNTNVTVIIKSPKKSLLSICAYNSVSTVLGNIKTTESSWSCSYVSTKRDTILCSIYNTNSNSSAPYEIFIVREHPTLTDTLHPNNTMTIAKLISDNQFTSFITQRSDTAWFKIPVLKNEIITTTISGDPANNTIFFMTNFYDSKQVGISGSYSAYSMSYNFFPSDYDTCYLKIYTNQTTAVFPYQYTITIKKTLKIDDKYENNNSKLKATLLLPGTTDSLYAFSNDTDYYKIIIDTNMYIEASIYTQIKQPTNGGLHINMETPTKRLIDTLIHLYDTLKLKYITEPHDTAFFSIVNVTSRTDNAFLVLYSLELKSKPIKVLDSLEPNNRRSEAVSIGNQILKSNLINSLDTDWYKIPLIAGQSVRVAITGNSQKANYGFIFTGSDNQIIAGSPSGDSTIY